MEDFGIKPVLCYTHGGVSLHYQWLPNLHHYIKSTVEFNSDYLFPRSDLDQWVKATILQWIQGYIILFPHVQCG